MTILKEFREFISRGNVVDLAVGVIIGAAFNSIVKSLVDQVIMPPVGLLTSGVDFAKLEWVLRPDDPATPKSELVAIQYGAFINTLIQFLIVAVVVFLLVKLINRLRPPGGRRPDGARRSHPHRNPADRDQGRAAQITQPCNRPPGPPNPRPWRLPKRRSAV